MSAEYRRHGHSSTLHDRLRRAKLIASTALETRRDPLAIAWAVTGEMPEILAMGTHVKPLPAAPSSEQAPQLPSAQESIIDQQPMREKSAPQPEPNTQTGPKLTISMFRDTDQQGQLDAVAYYAGKYDAMRIAIAADPKKAQIAEARYKTRYLKNHPGVTGEEYDTMRAQVLERRAKRDADIAARVNRRVYEKVQTDFEGVDSPEEATRFIFSHRKHANAMLREHGHLVSTRPEPIKPSDETDLPLRPADWLQMFASPKSSFRLQEQLRMQFLLSMLSARIETGDQIKASDKLAQIQKLLNEKLYAGEVGSTTDVTVYVRLKDRTNTFLGFHDGKPTEPPTEDEHYQSFDLIMRKTKRSDLLAQTKTRDKTHTAAMAKALHKALRRSRKPEGDDEIREKDVEDTHGLKLVVLGDRKDAEIVIGEVFDALVENKQELCTKDVFGNPISPDGKITGGPLTVEIDDEPNPGNGSAELLQYSRIQMEFDGITHPMEIQVQPIKGYTNAELHIGRNFDGVAHQVYRANRHKDLEPVLDPHDVHELRRTTKARWQDVRSRISYILQNRGRIVFPHAFK